MRIYNVVVIRTEEEQGYFFKAIIKDGDSELWFDYYVQEPDFLRVVEDYRVFCYES